MAGDLPSSFSTPGRISPGRSTGVSGRLHGFSSASNGASTEAVSLRRRLPDTEGARLSLPKEIEEFDFTVTPVNETLVRELAGGDFLEQQHNVVLIGGTGTGKSHLAVALARACIRNGARGRFFNVVDVVNKLDAEARADRQGRTADLLCRLNFLILDEFGYLPFAQTGWQLLFHLISRLTSAPPSSSPRTSPSANGRASSATPR
jgi:DNA replication protein DnaC